jgi:hypothetical protein
LAAAQLPIKLRTADKREEITETLQAQVAEEGELPEECSQMRTVLSPLHDARIDEPPHGLHATPQALAQQIRYINLSDGRKYDGTTVHLKPAAKTLHAITHFWYTSKEFGVFLIALYK